jgi:hypothetical protein
VWDVYHVENFLLEPVAIRKAVTSLAGEERFATDEDVMTALQSAARDIVTRLVVEELQAEINADLVGQIRIGASPDARDIAAELRPSIEGSAERLTTRAARYDLENLEQRAAEVRQEMEDYLDKGEWVKRFPGRRVLARFAEQELRIAYEPLRNLVLDNMAADELRPESAQQVLDTILAAE